MRCSLLCTAPNARAKRVPVYLPWAAHCMRVQSLLLLSAVLAVLCVHVACQEHRLTRKLLMQLLATFASCLANWQAVE